MGIKKLVSKYKKLVDSKELGKRKKVKHLQHVLKKLKKYQGKIELALETASGDEKAKLLKQQTIVEKQQKKGNKLLKSLTTE